MTSLQDMAREILKAADAINNSMKQNEEFLVSSLAKRAKQAAEQYPYDTSLVTASNVLTSMADNKPLITRAEFNKIYEQLCSNSSKLGDVFAKELGREGLLKEPTYYPRDGESEPINDYDVVADPMLQNALAAAFDHGEYRPYSAKQAERAEKVCNAGLLEVGFAPKKISIFAGQEDLMLCKAEYETPKGMSSVIVPVEIKEGSALLPTVFLGQESFVDLKPELLRQHIVSTAGKSFHADGQKILQVLTQARYGIKKVASEVEMAAIAMRAERSGHDHDINGIVGFRVNAEPQELPVPEVEKTADHFEFAKRVTQPDGAARFVFNDRVVEAGRDIIIRKMANLGYPNVQVKVAGCEDNKINYAIGIGVNSAILAPVEVVGNNVFPPKVAVASGKIKSFSSEGIKELVDDTKADTRILAASSMSAGLKPTELVQQVKEAVYEGNYIKAEDAINVLGEIDKGAQKVAIAILMNSLSDPMAGSREGKETGRGDLLDAAAGVSSNRMIQLAEKQVRDVPVMNTYNIFFPEE